MCICVCVTIIIKNEDIKNMQEIWGNIEQTREIEGQGRVDIHA